MLQWVQSGLWDLHRINNMFTKERHKFFFCKGMLSSLHFSAVMTRNKQRFIRAVLTSGNSWLGSVFRFTLTWLKPEWIYSGTFREGQDITQHHKTQALCVLILHRLVLTITATAVVVDIINAKKNLRKQFSFHLKKAIMYSLYFWKYKCIQTLFFVYDQTFLVFFATQL